MAILNLLFGAGKGTTIQRNVSGKVSSFTLDATIKESYTSESDPTTNPVEEGADITDHVILKPDVLQIDGIISETPINVGTQAAGAVSSVGSTIGSNVAGALGSTAGALGASKASKSLVGLVSGKDRSLSDTVEEFKAIRDARLPITIVTGLRQYENYILKSFNVSRDQKTGKSFRVSLSLQELLIARSEIVNVPSIKSAVPTKSDGRKNGTETEGEKKRKGSILHNLIFGG